MKKTLILLPFLILNINTSLWAGWNSRLLGWDQSVVGFSSIAIDKNDKTHILYGPTYVKWNELSPKTWVTTNPFYGAFLTLDKNDIPHIFTHNYFGNPGYGSWNGTSWDIQIIENIFMSWDDSPYMVFDTSNYPHVAYVDEGVNTLIKYAEWNSSSWIIQTSTPPSWVGNDNSRAQLLLDTSGYSHIICFSSYGAGDFDLQHGQWNGTSWNYVTIDSQVQNYSYSHPVIDKHNCMHISYSKNEDLYYAKWDGVSWSTQVVCSGGYMGSSLALDKNGYPNIVFCNHGNITQNLYFAKWNGSQWSVEQIPNPNPNGTSWCSLALDSKDNAHIVYWTGNNYYYYVFSHNLPSSPYGLAGQIGSLPGQVHLTWQSPLDTDIGTGKYAVQFSSYYEVNWSTNNAQIKTNIFNISKGSDRSLDIYNLQLGVTYYFTTWMKNSNAEWSYPSNVGVCYVVPAFDPVSFTAVAAKSSLGNGESTSIVAELKDTYNNLVPNKPITFNIIGGTGTLNVNSLKTGENGQAKAYYTAPLDGVGRTTVRVTADSFNPIDIDLDIFMVITTYGGIVVAPDDENSYLELFLNSLPESAQVTMIPKSLTHGHGKAYEIKVLSADGSEQIYFMQVPAKLVLRYEIDTDGKVKNTDVPVEEAGSRLALYRFDGVNWVPVPSDVDTTKQTVTAYVNHFSEYSIMEKNQTTESVFDRVSPNPFAPASGTSFARADFYFTNPDNIATELKISSLTGRLIKKTLFNASDVPNWDGKDESGNIVEGGVYIFELKVGKKSHTGTVVLAK
jgi:hypothetical protein